MFVLPIWIYLCSRLITVFTYDSQRPPPPPGVLAVLEDSISSCIAAQLYIKLTFELLGENTLYVEFSCNAAVPPYPPLLVGGVVGWFAIGWGRHLRGPATEPGTISSGGPITGLGQ